MPPPTRFGFGTGNLVTSGLLVASIFVLPVRFWLVDGLIGAVAAVLLVSSVWLLADLRGAEKGARIAAFALLGLGLFAIGLAILTLAFLSSVHGRWLDYGLPWTVLALALLAPYTVVYPLLQLLRASPSLSEPQT
jgi:hypothetical protein